jgi:hypothetical protein
MMRHVRLVPFCLVLALWTDGRSACAAVPERAIQGAIDRGVAALKKRQHSDGHFGGYGAGSTALAALALLECGVAPDEECVRKAAAAVRAECPDMNRVYNLSLAIMFFDRLGDRQDVPLIQALTVRLLEGQFPEGGWSYTTPKVDEKEVQRLKKLLEQRVELKTKPDETPEGPPPLDPNLQERLRRLEQRPNGGQARIENQQAKPEGYIDNSNTQFAVLALWVARRHHLPADGALRQAERYFRTTQEQGRWHYIRFFDTESITVNPMYFVNSFSPRGQSAMTCAGLIGLAIGAGVARDAQIRTAPGPNGKQPALREPLRDPLVQAALLYVGGQLAQTLNTGLPAVQNLDNDYYFLWSVERVGVIYSLTHMAGLDWYQTGAFLILRHQDPQTGLWTGRYPAEIDTCFALLFLRKSNFARDLTANLLPKGKGGQTTLKTGDGADTPDSATAAKPTEADRLARELKTALPERQTKVLEQLRDTKGEEYTEALVKVIPQLSGAVQQKARDALAERMARMTAATLRSRLRDSRAELRRAAALACAMKEDKGFIPDLIETLDDPDSWVVRAAAVALRTLTGQDFGPSAHATGEERRKAVAAWKAWWQRQKGR